MPRSVVSPMSATVATRSRRQASAAVPATRRTAPASKSHPVGGATQARAQIPEAKAAASGASGAAGQTNLLAHSDELAQRGQLPRAQPQHAPQPVGGVEAAPALALLDDATGEARSHPGKSRDLFYAGVIQVERSGIRHRLGLDGCRARPSRPGNRRGRGRLGPRRGGPARRRPRAGLRRNGRRRVFSIETLQALGQVRKPRAPFAHAEPHEQDPREAPPAGGAEEEWAAARLLDRNAPGARPGPETPRAIRARRAPRARSPRGGKAAGAEGADTSSPPACHRRRAASRVLDQIQLTPKGANSN